MRFWVMLPTLEATHHNEQLLLMNWPSQMGTSQFLILKGDRMPFLHQHTFYCKLAYIGMYFKWLVKSKNLRINKIKKKSFNTPNVFSYSSRHSNNNSFFKRLMSGLANAKNPTMNLLYKFVMPKKDQTPLAVTRFCHSLMARTFFKSNLMFFKDNTCPKKSIFIWANSLFVLLT